MSKDDTAVNDEVVAGATATESAPVETENAAVDQDDGFEKIKDLPLLQSERETDSEAEQAPTDEPAAEETDSKPQEIDQATAKDDWDSLKGSSQERFQSMANERREAQRRIAELEAQQTRIAEGQQLLNEVNPETGEYYTPQEIDQLNWQNSQQSALERNNQELYSLQVEQNQHSINDDIMSAVKNYPIVNPNSPEYNAEIGEEFGQLLNDSLVYALPDGQQATRSTLLANNINPDTQATLVGSNVSAQKLAQFAAKSYAGAKAQGEVVGQANAQRATEKMLANADAPSGVSSAGQSSNLDSLFDRIKDVPLA